MGKKIFRKKSKKYNKRNNKTKRKRIKRSRNIRRTINKKGGASSNSRITVRPRRKPPKDVGGTTQESSGRPLPEMPPPKRSSKSRITVRPRRRNKLEAAQVRLAFAKLSISESELVDDIDVIIKIGVLLSDELLLPPNEYEKQWFEWVTEAKRHHPDMSDGNFPPLEKNLGGWISDEESDFPLEKKYTFTFDDLVIGNQYNYKGGNFPGQYTETDEIDIPSWAMGNFTISNININKSPDFFKITVLAVLRAGGIEYHEQLCMEFEFYLPGLHQKQNWKEIGWYWRGGGGIFPNHLDLFEKIN